MGQLAVSAHAVRVLRWYLTCSTLLYATGVLLTVLPSFLPQRSAPVTANITGGVIAVVLGVLALGWLAVAPRAMTFPVAAAAITSPVVIAFHQLASAEYLCLLGPVFLAIFVRGFCSPLRARLFVAGLTLLTVIALLISPAEEYTSAFIVVVVVIPAAAESYGAMTGALLAAACTDPLTGVLNRAGWELQTAAYLEDNAGLSMAVIAVDIDDFKGVNDRSGHAAGDRRLVEVTATLRELVPGAVIARMGGDEFAVLTAPATDVYLMGLLRSLNERLPDVSVGWARSADADIDLRVLGIEADDSLGAEKAARNRRPRLPVR